MLATRRPVGTTSAPCSASPSAMARPSPDVPPITTATRFVRSKTLAILVRAFHRATGVRIGPAIVRNQGRPAGTRGILVVGISAQLFVQFAVLAQFVAIQAHA